MKKKILLLATSVIFSMGLAGCASAPGLTSDSSASLGCLADDFTVVEKKDRSSFLGSYSEVIYDNETKVEYLIIFDGYRCGITPLYNADSTVKIYQEEEK